MNRRVSAAGKPASGARPTRGRVRAALLALIGVLFLVSIPWYRPTDSPPRLVLGLPDWVLVAIVCYVFIALLNAVAWLLTDVPDPEPDDPGREP
jgi:hypothetical protein